LREFFDTSVLVAAFRRGHVHHEPSIKRLAEAEKKHSACALHTFAEVYATMTALPVKPLIPPEQVFLFIQEMRQRLSPISLDPAEYYDTIQKAADRGLTNGRVYDALLLGCAAKSKAQIIYTWNLKHFHSIAPQFAPRIQTP
jgi:predicted nucleic acid-binding protein